MFLWTVKTKVKSSGRERREKCRRSLLCLILMFAVAFSVVFAQSETVLADDVFTNGNTLPDIEAKTGYMIEVNTQTVLYDYGGDDIMYPASTTKIMTALLVIENCEDFNDIVTFSNSAVNDISWDSSKIGASVGEEMTVEQLMYGIFLKSGNDAAYALAEYIGGSMREFVNMMNERAEELGCVNTHFVNPHGLHDEDHYTTAHDLAIILQECIKHTEFLKFASADYYYIESTNKNPEGYRWYTSNHLLNDSYGIYDPRVIASKTGSTDEAGGCLVSAAKDGDMLIVTVVMKSSGEQRFNDTELLINYAFDNFKVCSLDADTYGYATSGSGMFGAWHGLILPEGLRIKAESAYVLLPVSANLSEVTSALTEADSSDENVIAKIVYTWEGETLGSSNLVLDTSGIGSALKALQTAQGIEIVEETEDESLTAAAGENTDASVDSYEQLGLNILIAMIAILAVIAAIIVVILIKNFMESKARRRKMMRSRK